MLTSIRYILLCALRDRLFGGLLAGVIAATLLASALGDTSFLEEREMALAFASASARFILVIGLIVFCCFHLRNAFDAKEIDVMLSRPLSRARLALAYWMGFAVVATLLVIPTAIVIALIGPLNYAGFAGWVISTLLEMWLVVAMALFASLALKSAVSSVLTCLAFYIVSRMMAYFVMTAMATHKTTLLLVASKKAITIISMLVPRLDFFGKSEWLIYGFIDAREWQIFLIQAAIFIPLLVLAAVIDFRRKQF